jgi:Uma2 family endonuclease
MATAKTLDRTYTPEELLALEDGTKYELIDGIPVERHVSVKSSHVGVRFAAKWFDHAETTGVGEVYASDLQVRAFPWDPRLVRKPDAAFIRTERVPQEDSGFLEIAPDAVVEVISPNDVMQEVREKVEQWLRAGVRMVWVAYPPQREITVYRPGSKPMLLTADDEIPGEDVIPGFQCPVADLFPAPITAPA